MLKPGGVVFAAAISRFASLLDGLRGPVFDHDAFARIVGARPRATGSTGTRPGRSSSSPRPSSTSPASSGSSCGRRGFALDGLFAVEGPGAFVPDFRRRWDDPTSRERLLDLVRRVEREPALLGVSPHLLAVGRR